MHAYARMYYYAHLVQTTSIKVPDMPHVEMAITVNGRESVWQAARPAPGADQGWVEFTQFYLTDRESGYYTVVAVQTDEQGWGFIQEVKSSLFAF